MIELMAAFHISEFEAEQDFPALMEKVRAGYEVVIESEKSPVAVLSPASLPRRSISESIAMAEAHEKELGYSPVMDEEFASDMREIVANRRPREPRDMSAWD